IAERLGCDHIELDAIHHLPDWTPIEREEMRRIVTKRTETESWVVDGNYASFVQDIVFSRADTVVWLDMPHSVTMSRVVRRTLSRGLLRRELWNGNRESLRNLLKTKPEENIVLWSWTQREKYRTKYRTARDDAAHADLNWVHLTSPREVRHWITTIS
ncbi:MAG: hypothetical protein GY926_06815, partial [bacterium]|nr:hypothetical protein [bacterium]MCP4964930.1 hypothetical protein [bacterium]